MPSMQLRPDDVVVGVDTHKDQHVAVLLDGLGGRLAELYLPASAAGFAPLLAFSQGHVGPQGRLQAFGVEGTGSYGIGLARFLRRHGHTVQEVHRPPRNGERRLAGKSDTIDAEHAARQVLAGRSTAVPKTAERRDRVPAALISERPAEVEDRAVPGHWEGDLIIGLERSAIGTLVERTTCLTMLVNLPREQGYRHKQSIKNGPALAGYGAITMKNALASTMSSLPEMRRSLTWDCGKELSAHAQFKIETGIPVFFADPHSPWQHGTNESTNGLLRQYFPKGTDLSRWPAEDLAAVAAALNNRPRKSLGWKTPAEVFNEQLLSLQQAGVATID